MGGQKGALVKQSRHTGDGVEIIGATTIVISEEHAQQVAETRDHGCAHHACGKEYSQVTPILERTGSTDVSQLGRLCRLHMLESQQASRIDFMDLETHCLHFYTLL
jgi:hypothetical protein